MHNDEIRLLLLDFCYIILMDINYQSAIYYFTWLLSSKLDVPDCTLVLSVSSYLYDGRVVISAIRDYMVELRSRPGTLVAL